MIKQSVKHFIHCQKQKQLLMKETFVMHFNQSILQLEHA